MASHSQDKATEPSPEDLLSAGSSLRCICHIRPDWSGWQDRNRVLAVSAGFWRVALALPLLVLFARANKQRLGGIPRGMIAAILVGGVLFGLDVASWHLGIGLTRMANATVFGNAGSLILMVWGFVALRRLPRGTEWPAMLAALAGAAILMARSFDISPRTFLGDLLCLFAGLLYVWVSCIVVGHQTFLW